MTTGTFDCRSCDLKSYACGILKNRVERFSTVYACCFITAAEAALAAGGAVETTAGDGHLAAADMLLTSNSIGELRLYRLIDLVQGGMAAGVSATAAAAPQSPEAPCCCSWVAHQGAAYCLAKAMAGSDVVILSGGDDGHVRGWRLSDVLRQVQARSLLRPPPAAAASEPAAAGASGPGPSACLTVRLPRAESPLAASSLPPAVQVLAPGARDGSGDSAVVFVGCSDGGVHCLDLTRGSVVQSSGPGHVAAVLSMDHHGPSSCLATGSEDGTVRLWDTRTGTGGGGGGAAAGRCARVLDTAGGREVPGGGAEALRCLRNPPVTCLRFEPSGNWLLCGHGAGFGGAAGGAGGGGGGGLSMWNLGMSQRARQVACSFTPQAMAVQPAEVLVVGSEAALSRYSLALEGPTRQPLGTRSAFALDVHPGSGAVAVGGVGASLELLSKYGKKTGGAAFVSDED